MRATTYIDHHDLEGLPLLKFDHNLPATVHSESSQDRTNAYSTYKGGSLSLSLSLSLLSLYSHSETFTPLKGSG